MCAAWKKKNERNEIVCFCCDQSDIILCGIARFSSGNKNKLRTFQPQQWKKIKSSQSQTKVTGFYKKRVYFEEHLGMSSSKFYLKRDYNTGVFLWTLLFKSTYFVVDLCMAGSATPVRVSVFNKVAGVMAWKYLTVLERDPSKGEFTSMLNAVY